MNFHLFFSFLSVCFWYTCVLNRMRNQGRCSSLISRLLSSSIWLALILDMKERRRRNRSYAIRRCRAIWHYRVFSFDRVDWQEDEEEEKETERKKIDIRYSNWVCPFSLTSSVSWILLFFLLWLLLSLGERKNRLLSIWCLRLIYFSWGKSEKQTLLSSLFPFILIKLTVPLSNWVSQEKKKKKKKLVHPCVYRYL